MTLPVLTKTWEFLPNIAFPAAGSALSDNKALFQAIPSKLTSTSGWVNASNVSTSPSNMWTVRYSCNASVAGSAGDGVNRWASTSDITFASGAHSWIVLRNTAIDTNFEILIDLGVTNGNGSAFIFVISPSAAFTGGTTSARPTATDEIVIANNATWGGAGTTDTDTRLHVMKTTDGTQWRLFIYKAGSCWTTWLIGKATAKHGSLTHPGFAYIQGSNSGETCTQALISAAGNFSFRGVSSATAGYGTPCLGSTRITATMTSANDLSGNWSVLEMGPFFSATASNRGAHAIIDDLWGVSESIVSGSTAPTSGTAHQFVNIGTGILHPWCQVACQVS